MVIFYVATLSVLILVCMGLAVHPQFPDTLMQRVSFGIVSMASAGEIDHMLQAGHANVASRLGLVLGLLLLIAATAWKHR